MTPSMDMPSGQNSMNNMGMAPMQMNFYWGKDVIILFSGWPGHTLGRYLTALLFVFVLAVTVEFLSVLRPVKPGSDRVPGGLSHVVAYTLRVGLAYLIMLAIMSFNIGVFVVAVLGHGIGFYLANSRAPDATANGLDSPTPVSV